MRPYLLDSLAAGAVALATICALALLLMLTSSAGAQAVTWPAPVVAGGAMPVTWNGITNPTPTDWIGVYFPEAGDWDGVEWMYVSCSREPSISARSAGTCGLVIPSDVPPGIYELRFFAADGFNRLATSPRFEILDGGWR